MITNLKFIENISFNKIILNDSSHTEIANWFVLNRSQLILKILTSNKKNNKQVVKNIINILYNNVHIRKISKSNVLYKKSKKHTFLKKYNIFITDYIN